jgi:cardiolipin synthase A/B
MRRAFIALCLLLMAFVPAQHAAAGYDLTLYIEPNAGVAPIVSFINTAQHTIDGEVYLASSKPILSALEAAAARHVRVRINLEEHPYGTGSAAPQLVYRTLASHGVQVRWTSRAFTFTHAKYMVADTSRAWIGTMNWTTSAFKSNREFALLTDDPSVVREAAAVFSADWAHTRYIGAEGAIVASPENARSQIEGLISHATHSLDIYAEELHDRAISQDITVAVQRGVAVRLVTIPGDNIGSLATTIPTVVRLTRLYVHAKVIIADGNTMYLGSENYSATSLDKNREMGLIVHEAGAIMAVESTFTQDVGTVAAATPLPKQTAGIAQGAFSVRAVVTPATMSYNAYPVLTAYTISGASCSAGVVYSTGRAPANFNGGTQTVPASGSVSWRWHEETKGTGGVATVTCNFKGATKTGQATFSIVNA